MSLSNMSRDTYRAHAQSIRANGSAHGLQWIVCPLEREDMKELINQRMSNDWLAERVFFSRYDSPAIAFRLTSYLTLKA